MDEQTKAVEEKQETWKERIMKPWVLIGLAGLAYQGLEKYGIAPSLGTWQLGVDLLCYVALGYAIYTDHQKKVA